MLIQTVKNKGLSLKSISKHIVVLKKMCNSKQPSSYNFICVEILKITKPMKSKYRYSLFHLNSVRPIYGIPKGLILEHGLHFLKKTPNQTKPKDQNTPPPQKTNPKNQTPHNLPQNPKSQSHITFLSTSLTLGTPAALDYFNF